MARGRMINKKISNSKRVNDIPLQAQLLFTWLIPHLDCNGCFYGSAQMIKSLVVPRKNWSKKQIEIWLVVMEKSKNSEGNPLIFRYTLNSEQYLFMPGFVGEQIGLRHDKERPEFPTFDGRVTEEIGQTVPLSRREVEVEVNTPKGGRRKTPSSIKKDSIVNDIFTEMRAYFGYPDKTSQDPIPSYGKEGQAIKRMLTRGFTREAIVECWKSKVSQRGGEFVSMTWVNHDIGQAGKRKPGSREPSSEADIAASIKEVGK